MVASLVACATGGKFQGTGGSGDGGSGGGPGGGGSGGSNTTTATTGGTTTTTTTTTSTSMQTCTESPCRLVSPQCGCDAGEMCAINSTGDRECHAAGATQLEQPCVGLFSCVPGALCVLVSSAESICTPYCDQDSQCGGGLCLIQLNDPSSPGNILQGVTLCSDDCDPTTAAGCPSGLGCQLGQEQTGQMRTFTVCGGAGNGGQGTLCTDNEDCSVGSACFTLSDMSQECLKYCKVNSPSCPGAATCLSFDPPILYKGTEYGACL